MPIVCLEGPSAVGKTTTAAALAASGDVYVVAETNVLFARPAEETPTWYLERQVERWTMATLATDHFPLVVLDGDPFQPLWYNAAYGYRGLQSLDVLEGFYRRHVARGTLGFPDRYVLLGASESQLRAQKAGDRTRGRRHFKQHLEFIDLQRRYFEHMERRAPGRVRFVEAARVEARAAAVRDGVRAAPTVPTPLTLFDALIAWLRAHPLG